MKLSQLNTSEIESRLMAVIKSLEPKLKKHFKIIHQKWHSLLVDYKPGETEYSKRLEIRVVPAEKPEAPSTADPFSTVSDAYSNESDIDHICDSLYDTLTVDGIQYQIQAWMADDWNPPWGPNRPKQVVVLAWLSV